MAGRQNSHHYSLDPVKLIKGDRNVFSVDNVIIELRDSTRVTCFSNFECTRKLLRAHRPTWYPITRRVMLETSAAARAKSYKFAETVGES